MIIAFTLEFRITISRLSFAIFIINFENFLENYTYQNLSCFLLFKIGL